VVNTSSWRQPLLVGLGLAFTLRAALTSVHAGLWLLLANQPWFTQILSNRPEPLPVLPGPAAAIAFGVWRRWDVVHYLELAHTDELRVFANSVFGPAAPTLFRIGDRLLPGGLDFAAALIQCVLFGVALAILWQLCRVYYHDDRLGRYAVVVTATLPMAYVFYAPMSESLYLALTLGAFYAAIRRCWLLSACCGALAVLTRFQGVILILPLAALLYEQRDRQQTAKRQLTTAIQTGWPLLLIPLTYGVIIAIRQALGYPPLNDLYLHVSYVFFVNPLEGLALNLRWVLLNPSALVTNPDFIAMVVYGLLIVLMLRDARHRRPMLLVYTASTVLVIFSKVNFRYGTDELLYTQSFARYALVLWPVHVFLADRIRASRPVVRKAVLLGLACSFLIMGTVNMFYMAPP
jgi:hypothetical protein